MDEKRNFTQVFIQAHMFAMGLVFLVAAYTQDKPVMDERVYGSGVGSYRAEWWALAVLLASGAMLAGLLTDGKYALVARFFGAVLHVLIMSAFIAGGAKSSAGMHLVVWSAVMLSVHCFFLAWSTSDLVRGLRHGSVAR